MKAGGIAEPFGNDFVAVTGEHWATKTPGPPTVTGALMNEVAVCMHELGHNLGLGHGGPWPRSTWTDWDSLTIQANTNYKPNYLSIMNYTFQWTNRVPTRPLDFSRWKLPTLYEAFLDETLGLHPANPDLATLWPRTAYTVHDNWKDFHAKPTVGPIDWNDDGHLETIEQAGINDYWSGTVPTPTPPIPKNDVLVGAEDWSQLFYNFRVSPYAARGAHTTMPSAEPEMPIEQVLEDAKHIDFDGDGLSNADDNVPFVYNPDQTDSDGDGIGDAGELADFSFDLPSVPGGEPVNAIVRLLLAAPPEGATISFYPSDTTVADLPIRVTIPAGEKVARVPVATSSLLQENASVTIYAVYGDDFLSSELTVGPPAPHVDLEVSQATSPDPALAGAAMVYTLTVENRGPDDVTGVTLTDVLPAGASLVDVTCSQGTYTATDDSAVILLGGLAAGAQATATVTVRPLAVGDLTNEVTVTSDGIEDDPADNTSVLVATVVPLPTLVVNTTDDAADGVYDPAHLSLREAIELANAGPGLDTIHFDVPGPGPHTIQPASPLPVITDPVVIDATTEPDYAGAPVVQLDGSLAGPANGLHVTAGGSTIRGLAINQFAAQPDVLKSGHGIVLDGGEGNLVEACYVGIDVTGSAALGNGGAGILVLESIGNTIGGTTPGARNVISGNQRQGILLAFQAHGNLVIGNYLGTDATGGTPLGNLLSGVEIVDARENLVGGTDPGTRNVISGNAVGVTIRGTHGMVVPTANRIEGNYIGTNAAGDAAIANGIGVSIVDADLNVVGGAVAGAGNVVSGNGVGIQVFGYGILGGIGLPPMFSEANQILGNSVGLAADGTSPLGNASHGIFVDWGGNLAIGGIDGGESNTIAFNGGDGVYVKRSANHVIRGNAIFSNTGLGIDWGVDGVYQNRPPSAAGFFYGSNYPVLTRAFSGAGSTTIEGTITGPASPAQGIVQPCVVDFYSTPIADPSGHGEGTTYLGSITVSPRGEAPFSTTFPVEAAPGHLITATSTREDDTSEFAFSIEVQPDADGDSVLDAVEDAAPGGGDGNGDGILDRLQGDVVSLPNAVDGSYVVLVASGGEFRDVRAVPNPSPHDGPPAVEFPIGFFEFTLLATGSSTVSFFPPSGVDLATAYYYGPTLSRPFDHWYQAPSGNVEVHPDHLDVHSVGVTPIGPAVILPGAGTTIVVNATDDVDDGVPDGVHTTLREAINLADYLPGKDRIVFDIPGDGPHTIQPTSALPTVTDPVIIDGYTQPGASPATDEEPAVIMIELDGSLAGTAVDGLGISAGNCAVRGLCINRFQSDRYGWYGGVQIGIGGSSGSVVEGNYIGVDPSGTVAYWELGQYDYSQAHGVCVYSDDNVIGGTTPAARNVVSGFSGAAIDGSGTGNRIQGNYIGTDATGTQALGNDRGISLDTYSTQCVIGGTEIGAGNLISGNWDAAVVLASGGMGLWENRVQGNLIGTDVTGTTALGNGTGIAIAAGFNNLIGGTVPEARNVISGNNGPGIVISRIEAVSIGNVVQGNLIGTDVTGSAPLGNAGDGITIYGACDNMIGGTEPGAANLIAHNGGRGVSVISGLGNAVWNNQIHSNGDLGIDLGEDGVTENDPADGGVQPEWEIHDLTVEFDGEHTTISATVTGPPDTYAVVWLYVNGPSPPIIFWGLYTDESGVGELQVDWLQGPHDLVNVVVRDWETLNLANGFQNYPVLNSAVLAEGTTVEGMLDSTPETTFRLEFFSNAEADGSGYGEGETFLGSVDVTTDTSGIADFSAAFTQRVPLGHFITATATDPEGNTSEFSAAVEVTAESLDFGDAPDPAFPTLLASDGARHVVVAGFHLGAGVDPETDGQPGELADGDDAADADDEDGVKFLTPLVPGHLAAVEVTASASGVLDGWLDFSGDGEWLDDQEQVFAGVLLSPGQNLLFFPVPETALVTERTFARFRFSSDGGLLPHGVAADGEVEDYAVAVVRSNAPPVADDDEAETPFGIPVTIEVTANDTDPDGNLDPTTVRITVPPAGGSATVDRLTGIVTYTPGPGVTGSDQFTYEVSDAEGVSDTAVVSIEILPANEPPVAEDDDATTDEDEPVTIDLVDNDSDPEGELDPTSVRLLTWPSHGSIQIDPATGVASYVPEADFHGSDVFLYEIADVHGAIDMAAVFVTVESVNDPPTARDDRDTTLETQPVVIDVAANDSDIDGNLDPDSLMVIDGPSGGRVDPGPGSGELTYTPFAAFTGIDTFTYRIFDTEGEFDEAEVTVQVLPLNSPPVAADDMAVTDEGSSVSIDVVANDSDPDGNLDPGSVRILVDPRNGSAEVDPTSGEITYTPGDDFDGAELFAYEIRDTADEWAVAVVSVVIRPVNDPPLAVDDTATIDKDTAAVLDVLRNDVDPEGGIDPGTLTIEHAPGKGSAVVGESGLVLYTPLPGFLGSDSFTYMVQDDQGATSNEATVQITIREVPATSIQGRKFEDLDGSGPELDGPGLDGFTVHLFDAQGQLVATAQTRADDPGTPDDEAGRYRFDGLAPGTYVLAEEAVPGWAQSHPPDQGIRPPLSDLALGTHVVTVGLTTPATNVDFGNYRSEELPCSICGYVYVDTDNDGVKDPTEPGLPNVPIELGGSLRATVFTQADGCYRFELLPPGVYTLTETQPGAFVDGLDTQGTPPCSRVQNDCFVGIGLAPGTDALDYNFGERGLIPELISKRLFLASTPPLEELLLGLTLVDDDVWLGFQATEDTILHAELSGYQGEPPAIELYGSDWMPVAIGAGTPWLEAEVAEGESYVLHVAGAGSDADLRLTNTVGQESNHEVISGTEQNDVFEFRPGPAPGHWTVKVNGVTHQFSAETITVELDGLGGDDTVLLTGSAGKDTVELWPGRGTLSGEGYTVHIADAESITVLGGGGPDVAVLHDDPDGDDTFQSWPEQAKLYGDGFFNRVRSFRWVHAFSTGGKDMAVLHDDPTGVDTFKFWPEEAKLYGDGFYTRAKAFRQVHAFSTPDNDDVAVLYDNPDGKDTFKFWPGEAKLYGDGFYNRAKAFRWVHAFSTPGNDDVAVLYDDPQGDETFKAWPEQAKLYGDGFFNRAKGFRWVHAFATGGTDVAHLYGSAAKDTLVATPEYTRLYGPEYFNRAVSFDQVHAHAGGGQDVAILYDAALEAGLVHYANVDAILWLYQFDQINQHDTETEEDTSTEAVDEIFTAYWP